MIARDKPNYVFNIVTTIVSEGKMTSLEKRDFRFIKYQPGCTAQDIRNNYARSPRLEQVEEILESLVAKGFISSSSNNEQTSSYEIIGKTTKKNNLKDVIVS